MRSDDAVALLERANPVEPNQLASAGEVAAARERVRAMITAEAPAVPRRGVPKLRRLTGARLPFGITAFGAVAVAAFLVLSSSTGSGVPTASAMTLRRAAEAVEPAPGSILHIDYTLTTSYPGGEHWSTRQDTWQQQLGAGCNYLNLQIGAPGTPTGTEGGTVDGSEEVYDPVRNTIYVAPPVTSHLDSPPAGAAPPNECSFMAGFANQVRGLLSSGQARVAGHATIDGRDTIKIVSGANTYYVAADGSYAPVELVNGSPTDKSGMSTFTFHAYGQLPAAAGGRLLSLTAQHPTATVDRSLGDFRAAINRLFPDG
jgi:hypothetical protein